VDSFEVILKTMHVTVPLDKVMTRDDQEEFMLV
jgi:hypothetical protein